MRKQTADDSHFGDLQFLHAMASRDGELAADTKTRIMTWAQFVWGVTTGQHVLGTRLKDVPLEGMREHFGRTEWTVQDLFTLGKCIFNLVPCDKEFKKEFVRFLERAEDVLRFAKLPEQFGFAIEYTDGNANLRYYEPDFVALTKDGTHYILETKGLEDVNVVNKDRAAKLWCENTSKLTGKPWQYLKVLQTEFTRLQPTSFSDVLVLKPSQMI